MLDFDEGLNLVRKWRTQQKDWPQILQALQAKPHNIPESQAKIFMESIQAEESRNGGPPILDPREMPAPEEESGETVQDLLGAFTEPTTTGSIEDEPPALAE